MGRKLMAFALIFTMLASLSPAVAADEMSAQPTVEEILNEYHQKAFEAQTRGDADSTSTWSRRGSSAKTLEQETVDTLTDAGYEAYNVTADNYDTLENELKTDFAAMGLDPEGSYIVVISGEEPSSTNGARVGGSNIDQSTGDLLDGGSHFEHTHNGTTYQMRYVIVTSATGTSMSVYSTYDLQSNIWYENLAMDALDATLVAVVDSMVVIGKQNIPLGTIASLLFGAAIDENYSEFETGTLSIHASTTWTAQSIQIWESSTEKWKTGQSSASAHTRARCVGYVQNPVTGKSEWKNGEEYSTTRFSAKYSDTSQRLSDAVYGYNNGFIYYDRTGDIDFHLGNETGEIIYTASAGPLFTHAEWWTVPSEN